MEIDLSESANGTGAENSSLMHVLPSASGSGLPFAPVDWPNPGDIWTWKVGNKIGPSGNYLHRFLIVPERLQQSPTRKVWLGSKPSVIRFLQSEFPQADVEAFFSSFTWDIPGRTNPTNKVAAKRKVSSKKTKRANGVEPVNQISKRTRNSMKKIIDVTETENENVEGFDPDVVAIYPTQNASKDSTSLADHLAEMSSKEFEIYLNSLDDVLPPTPSIPPNNPVSAPLLKMGDFTKARKKLTSLLALDFPSLISSNKLKEITNLSSKLQSDPNLTSEELCMLNLIQEIPSSRDCLLDAKKVKEEASKFFVELQGNIVRIRDIKSEYMIMKDKITLIQAENESATSTIEEIDEQIAVLQTRKAMLAKVVNKSEKKIATLTSTQKKLHESIPVIADEVQKAISERAEWEMKEKGADEQEAEILAKFASLQGFSFLH